MATEEGFWGTPNGNTTKAGLCALPQPVGLLRQRIDPPGATLGEKRRKQSSANHQWLHAIYKHYNKQQILKQHETSPKNISNLNTPPKHAMNNSKTNLLQVPRFLTCFPSENLDLPNRSLEKVKNNIPIKGLV